MLPRARRPVEDGWFQIRNSADGAQVHIYAEIGLGGITAAKLTEELRAMDVPHIDLRINSPGGDVYDGITIHNALKAHPAHVHVHVDGVAASIASVIAMAGDEVTMARGSQMMIHEGHTVAAGTAEDMRKTATVLDRFSDTIADFYAARAGGTRETWRNRMKAETWYDANEAVKAGLADKVETPTRTLKASFDLSVFNYAGRLHAPPPDLSTPDPEPVQALAVAAEPDPEPVADPDPVEPDPIPVTALLAAPVVVQQPKDVWNELIAPLLRPSNQDAVLAALMEGK